MKRYLIWGLGLMWCASSVQAQQMEEILQSVAQNNVELQARQQELEAAGLEIRMQNSLEDPSVEYSPFFRKGESGMTSSELVVKQGFDFPTVYAARGKAGKLQRSALERQWGAARQEVLLQAKNLCLDLVLYNQTRELLEERKKNADEMLALFEKRLQEGDANILEVNKIKMERMNVQTEVAQNMAAHRTALQQLLALNGNRPLNFSSDRYPRTEAPADFNALYDEVMASDAQLQAANMEAQAAEQVLQVNKQNWLPKLEVAYRRNTDMSESSNGFLIGGSLPLYSSHRKLKIARAQALSARLTLDDARLQREAALHGQFNELCRLKEAMDVYDIPLMHETLRMLHDAVVAGQLSIIEFYVETENVYQNLQAYMSLENQYQKLLAEVYRCRL